MFLPQGRSKPPEHGLDLPEARSASPGMAVFVATELVRQGY
ncbi:MAG TPA: hypothetical protein VIL69_08385 [Roseomonas sp.]|jgi:hypothetical protein